MTDTRIFFGTPGNLTVLPHPRGGVKTTRVRPTQEFPLGNGEYRTRTALAGSRTFELKYERIQYALHATLLAFDQGHMGPGPFVLLDPGQRNQLTVNQSSATSLTNDTSNFTIAGSAQTISSSAAVTLGTPRSLAWNFNTTSPASAASFLFTESPYAGWYGIPVVSRPYTFSCQMRGGGTDGVITFQAEIAWYDLTGAQVGAVGSSGVVTSTSAWTPLSVTGTPPADAVFARPYLHYASGASFGSIGYFAQLQFEEGSTPGLWTPGTGIYPVSRVSYTDEWPWLYADEVRENPTLVLREDGR